jgi:hypothetical protein
MPLNDVYSGADGTLVLFDGGTNAEAAETNAITDLEAFTIAVVGRVTGVELHVDTDLREFHEVGRRHATSLHPGNIHIWGTIDHAYVNGALLYLLLGRGASPNSFPEPYPQPALGMNLAFQNPAVPGHRSVIDVVDIKLENWAVRMPEDEFVMEKVRFRALRVNVRDQEGTEIRVPTFPTAA